MTAINSMPVSLFVGEYDDVCTARRANELAEAMGNLQNHYVFRGWDHLQPWNSDSDSYMDLIMAEVDGTLLEKPNHTYVLFDDHHRSLVPEKEAMSADSLFNGSTMTVAIVAAIMNWIF